MATARGSLPVGSLRIRRNRTTRNESTGGSNGTHSRMSACSTSIGGRCDRMSRGRVELHLESGDRLLAAPHVFGPQGSGRVEVGGLVHICPNDFRFVVTSGAFSRR